MKPETIFENPLDKEDVKQIIQNGEEMGHLVVLATKRQDRSKWIRRRPR